MKICFSCRVTHDKEALMLRQDSDMICAGCFKKFATARDEGGPTDFQEWRQGDEAFGFDPYQEREVEVQMMSGSAAALVPLSRRSLDLIEMARDRCPSMGTQELVEQALQCLNEKLDSIEEQAMERSMLAHMIGMHVAAAMRGEE